EKQVEWAAASSSSGVVTESEPPARAFHSTSNRDSPEESSGVRPDPVNRAPFQTVLALLTTGLGMVAPPRCAGGPLRCLLHSHGRVRSQTESAWGPPGWRCGDGAERAGWRRPSSQTGSSDS